MTVTYDWSAVQRYYDEGNDRDACIAKFGFTIGSWYKAIRFGRLSASLEPRYDWVAIQLYYDEGHTYRECKLPVRLQAGDVDEGRAYGEDATPTAALAYRARPCRIQEPPNRQTSLARCWYTEKRMRGVRNHGLEGQANLHPTGPPQRRSRRPPPGKLADVVPKLPQSNGDVRRTQQKNTQVIPR
jgi:hypothetical protein